MFVLSIETRLPCLYGLEKKQEMTLSLLAESYWPSCVGIDRICRSYDLDRFCHIKTVLQIVN